MTINIVYLNTDICIQFQCKKLRSILFHLASVFQSGILCNKPQINYNIKHIDRTNNTCITNKLFKYKYVLINKPVNRKVFTMNTKITLVWIMSFQTENISSKSLFNIFNKLLLLINERSVTFKFVRLCYRHKLY